MPERPTYTRGSIAKVMFSTALSMVPGTLAISGYNIVDTYFVGLLGTDPLAAMGFTFPVVMIVGCIYHGLGGGVMTPVAQLLGGGRRDQAARMVTSGIVLFTLIGLAMTAAGIALIDQIFQMQGAKPELMPMIRQYMTIWFLGSLSVSLGGAGTHLLVSAGVPKLGGLMMLFGLALNAELDPLFIFGWKFIPRMGIAGAAIATVIAQVTALALVTTLLHFRHHLIAPLSALFPYPRVLHAWRTIFRYGIPAILGMVLNPAGMAVITYAVATTGGRRRWRRSRRRDGWRRWRSCSRCRSGCRFCRSSGRTSARSASTASTSAGASRCASRSCISCSCRSPTTAAPRTRRGSSPETPKWSR